MTPAMLVARYLENDADKDGKLSTTEIAGMDERRRQGLSDADRNKDGFLDDKELAVAAGQAMQRMRENAGGRGGGGRRGEGGPPGGAGPAGGE
jgi:hypothetical protein